MSDTSPGDEGAGGGGGADGAASATLDEPHRANKLLFVIACSIVTVALAAVSFALVYFREILVPFTLAMFLSYLLEPLVEVICRALVCQCLRPTGAGSGKQRGKTGAAYGSTDDSAAHRTSGGDEQQPVHGAARWAAVVMVITLVVGLVVVLVLIITVQIQDIVQDQDKYHERGVAFMNDVEGVLGVLHVNLNETQDVEKLLSGFFVSEGSTLMKELADTAFQLVNGTVLFLLFLLFVMGCRETLPEAADPALDRSGPATIWQDIDQQVRRYIVLKTMLSMVVGMAVGTTLHFLDIDLSLLFALITFAANYVPNVGALVATLAPIPLIILDPEVNLTEGVLAIVLPTVMHLVVGSVIEPLVFEWDKKIELHPVVVLLAMSIWGMLWGIPGMVLSVPLAVVAKVLLEHMELRTGELQIFGPLADFIKSRGHQKLLAKKTA